MTNRRIQIRFLSPHPLLWSSSTVILRSAFESNSDACLSITLRDVESMLNVSASRAIHLPSPTPKELVQSSCCVSSSALNYSLPWILIHWLPVPVHEYPSRPLQASVIRESDFEAPGKLLPASVLKVFGRRALANTCLEDYFKPVCGGTHMYTLNAGSRMDGWPSLAKHGSGFER
jgi:hypothetical protein